MGPVVATLLDEMGFGCARTDDDLWSAPGQPFPGLAGRGTSGLAGMAPSATSGDDPAGAGTSVAAGSASPDGPGPASVDEPGLASPDGPGPASVDEPGLASPDGPGPASVDEPGLACPEGGDPEDLVLATSRKARIPLRRVVRRTELRLRALRVGTAGPTGPGRVTRPTPRVLRTAALVVAVVAIAAVATDMGLSGGNLPAAAVGHVRRQDGASPGSTGASSSSTAAAPKSSLPKGAIVVPRAPGPTGASGGSGSSAGSSLLGTSPSGTTGPGAGASAPGASPTAPSTGLTPAVAAGVLTSLWSRRASALASRNVGQLSTFEDGVALQSDEAALTGASDPWLPSSAGAQIVVTSASSYPLEFLALMPGTAPIGGPEVVLAGAWQPSRSAPWLLALLVTMPESQASSSGSAPGAADVGPSTLVALASAWQSWSLAGAAPAGTASNGGPTFIGGDAYSAVGQQVVEQIQLASLDGMRERVTFTAAQTPGSVFAEPGSGRMVCGGVEEQATFTSTSGAMIVQPADRSTWGVAVSPGGYQSITRDSVIPVCIVSRSNGVAVIGGTAATYATSATG